MKVKTAELSEKQSEHLFEQWFERTFRTHIKERALWKSHGNSLSRRLTKSLATLSTSVSAKIAMAIIWRGICR